MEIYIPFSVQHISFDYFRCYAIFRSLRGIIYAWVPSSDASCTRILSQSYHVGLYLPIRIRTKRARELGFETHKFSCVARSPIFCRMSCKDLSPLTPSHSWGAARSILVAINTYIFLVYQTYLSGYFKGTQSFRRIFWQLYKGWKHYRKRFCLCAFRNMIK